jgi:hypothetical protein
LDRDNISTSLTAFITRSFPNGKDLRTTKPQLLTRPELAEIAITQSSEVFVTFVTQIANATSTLAFYTYLTNQPPATTKDVKTITHIFPHSGNNTPLQLGDKVKIGKFNAGTSVGFVVIQKGWDVTTNAINTKGEHFYTHDALNPEADPSLKRHAV